MELKNNYRDTLRFHATCDVQQMMEYTENAVFAMCCSIIAVAKPKAFFGDPECSLAPIGLEIEGSQTSQDQWENALLRLFDLGPVKASKALGLLVQISSVAIIKSAQHSSWLVTYSWLIFDYACV